MHGTPSGANRASVHALQMRTLMCGMGPPSWGQSEFSCEGGGGEGSLLLFVFMVG